MGTHPPAPPEVATEAAETHQRISRLRRLMGDPPRRQRLIFGFSLLSFALVSLMAYLVDRFPVSPFDLAPTRALQTISNALFLELMVAISLFGFLPWSAIMVAGGVLLVSVLLGWKDGAYSIGPSRMYLGAHWLSDVIAAYLFGVIILAFGIEFYLRDLAPRAPTPQGGLVGAHDQAVKSAEDLAR
jgi:hypothetical protein